ncbi:peptide cleavage/export ABC transporter [Bombilactobacillus folatiphilus]|uniref:Peptide cleavage/export ABC transporter n=1 Tax=Bombilactobacillus folatiphilus TaxID=2923362 RepID=A0ABY4PBB2_9LACO|nr:peptide cleavage/export ABC transporter [Bombilactobacillus folatiphilus]UQS82806.1 peptide cleavage/export ABC transporter [Bombilactobacillus folatiphilus]
MLNIKRIYTPQVDEQDCGVAALAMILKNYGSRVSLAQLRMYTKTTTAGTTAFGIKKAAEQFHLDVQAVQADLALFQTKQVPYPFIAHVVKKGNLEHYYVVLKANKHHIAIADPNSAVKIVKMDYQQFAQEWTGVALFFQPTADYHPVQNQQRESLLQFIPVIFKQKRLLAKIILAALIVTIISILGSYFVQSLIDTYIPQQLVNTLSIIAIGLLVAYVFQAVFSYIQNCLLAVLGQHLSVDILLDYVRHLFELPMSFFATRKTGDVISRFNDASKITDALASSIISIGLDLTIVLLTGVVLTIQNRLLFIITLLVLPVYMVIIWSFNKPFVKLNQKQMESNSQLNSTIIEDLHGMETIKSLSSEHQSYQKIDHEFSDVLEKSLKYIKADQLQQALKLFVQLGLSVVILWVGAILVVHKVLTVGQLMTFNALLTYFTNPLQNIINLQPKIKSAQVANNRLNEIYLVESEFKQSRPLQDPTLLQGDITFNNVSYHYGYGADVVRDVSLTIPAQTKLTIVGMSGSGKSTLVKLLVDFFTPTQGQILINGHQLTAIDKMTLRQQIVYVPQEPYIFSGTILENLQLGNRSGVQLADVRQACQIAQIQMEIEQLPLQYETKLDENGDMLSGGQKQRLTIARALLSPAQVLIFDESTSGLDAITEAKLVQALLCLPQTVIFIAHRLAIAQKTNNIVVLKQGKLIEQGTHQALVAQQGEYYRLLKATGSGL